LNANQPRFEATAARTLERVKFVPRPVRLFNSNQAESHFAQLAWGQRGSFRFRFVCHLVRQSCFFRTMDPIARQDLINAADQGPRGRDDPHGGQGQIMHVSAGLELEPVNRDAVAFEIGDSLPEGSRHGVPPFIQAGAQRMLSATGACRPWPLPVMSHHARHRSSSQSFLSPNVASPSQKQQMTTIELWKRGEVPRSALRDLERRF
jgi:hypothetical protein